MKFLWNKDKTDCIRSSYVMEIRIRPLLSGCFYIYCTTPIKSDDTNFPLHRFEFGEFKDLKEAQDFASNLEAEMGDSKEIFILKDGIAKRDKIINSLVEKVRLYHEKYGCEYIGGRAFQFILSDIEELKK